jgi:site-specific DNA-methyltransferase (adenine-specific)
MAAIQRLIDIHQGRAQEVLPTLDRQFDLVLADLPYGKTRNEWDVPFELDWMWREFTRLTRPESPIVLFAQGTFAIDLIISNRKNFRYDLVWQKDRTSGFLNARRQPLRSHEYILVFYRKQPTYNPQMVRSDKATHSRGKWGGNKMDERNYGQYVAQQEITDPHLRHPKSVLSFARDHPMIHPTQKPVELCEWLIRSFTNEGGYILDPCFGSGSTLLAAKQTGRAIVGVEVNGEYVEMTKGRLG